MTHFTDCPPLWQGAKAEEELPAEEISGDVNTVVFSSLGEFAVWAYGEWACVLNCCTESM